MVRQKPGGREGKGREGKGREEGKRERGRTKGGKGTFSQRRNYLTGWGKGVRGSRRGNFNFLPFPFYSYPTPSFHPWLNVGDSSIQEGEEGRKEGKAGKGKEKPKKERKGRKVFEWVRENRDSAGTFDIRVSFSLCHLFFEKTNKEKTPLNETLSILDKAIGNDFGHGIANRIGASVFLRSVSLAIGISHHVGNVEGESHSYHKEPRKLKFDQGNNSKEDPNSRGDIKGIPEQFWISGVDVTSILFQRLIDCFTQRLEIMEN